MMIILNLITYVIYVLLSFITSYLLILLSFVTPTTGLAQLEKGRFNFIKYLNRGI